MALIGFARVSTQGQDLESQLERLQAAGCERIFSGKRSGVATANAEAQAEMLSYVRAGDTVIVAKLDRLGRSLKQLLEIIDQLTAKGVSLKALDQPIDTGKDDPFSRAMTQLLGVFAELERSFIVSRTAEGKQASGNYGGRPHRLTPEQRLEIRARLAKGESKRALSAEYGVSRATIMRVEQAAT